MRLDKMLSDSGFGTRSQVREFIHSGRVAVNGNPVKDISLRVENPETVTFDKHPIFYSAYSYYMLNKPAGVVTATSDKLQKTVMDLITVPKRRDLFPVGRLDKDTEGLLVITNNGQLAHRLLAPGKHVEKKYLAWISGELDTEKITAFENGLDIGDETMTHPAKLKLVDGICKLEMECDSNLVLTEVRITEGRYHQIKRMFEAVDCKVEHLKRISMGPVELDGELSPGEYRKLTDEEIKSICIDQTGSDLFD